MKLFNCPACGGQVHFENAACVRCGAGVGYDPAARQMARPGHGLLPCANAGDAGCNWLVPEGAPGGLCTSCAYTRTIPDLALPGIRARWGRAELAKRWLLYSLDRWGLPVPGRAERPGDGLAFDFLAEEAADGPVMTGHASGVITLNLAEADPAERVRRREGMGEPYRTLTGHMRHEIAHFYWDLLLREGPMLEEFRALFGDERADYAAALERHYAEGPSPGWEQAHISAYAASHPWEDFAETWAHWLHMTDTLETAAAYGLALQPGAGGGAPQPLAPFDPYAPPGAAAVTAAWVPLTIAINDLNRSMGQPDLYPFVLSRPVEAKLDFVHRLIAGAGG